jgi:hypothetical protein
MPPDHDSMLKKKSRARRPQSAPCPFDQDTFRTASFAAGRRPARSPAAQPKLKVEPILAGCGHDSEFAFRRSDSHRVKSGQTAVANNFLRSPDPFCLDLAPCNVGRHISREGGLDAQRLKRNRCARHYVHASGSLSPQNEGSDRQFVFWEAKLSGEKFGFRDAPKPSLFQSRASFRIRGK